MNISNLTTGALRNLIKLTERKEVLARQIETIEAELAALISGKPAAKRRGRPTGKRSGRPATGARRGRKAGKTKKVGTSNRAGRGSLKKKIFTALKAAGEKGVKVTELSKRLGVKNANVHVWFSTTGKKFPEIVRTGKGEFKLQEKK
jgi:hypothetical protein